jgi:Glutaminase
MKLAAKDTGILTVATIRKRRRRGATQYLFNERQRIFTLPSTTRSFKATSKLLDTSLRRGVPIKVTLDTRRGHIKAAEEPSQQALRKFRDLRALLEEPSRSIRLDVTRTDPTTFNIVDYGLKWPCFKLCKKVLPSYAKAREIFDFCAKQSCHLPGPYDISPCIPFQYVVDGCYARAHKMRWIITTKYRYCCEKVFSFANQNDDSLAVKADKWGGYCVC